ncbi:hypothetical protein DdX_18374 [Ditylenchus destructor]|uniref:Uncharacterized protein n=1 Tax=Ditylenchus destructor TaxID=166010 RepID=A0AAD4QUY8_9BILA|nr:hypothetical protein DdX_18374 [Ditylenchus destructor]
MTVRPMIVIWAKERSKVPTDEIISTTIRSLATHEIQKNNYPLSSNNFGELPQKTPVQTLVGFSCLPAAHDRYYLHVFAAMTVFTTFMNM